MERDREYYELRKDLAQQVYGMIRDRDERDKELRRQVSEMQWKVDRALTWDHVWYAAYGALLTWFVMQTWRTAAEWLLIALLFLKSLF